MPVNKPPIDELCKKVDCRYTLVVESAKRARELVAGTPAMIDALLALGWLPEAHSLRTGIPELLLGMEILAAGTCFYMKSALGSGPRDALMVVLARKTGRSVGFCRVAVEALAVLIGWRMGGSVGVGTLLGAFGVGTLINLNLRLMGFGAEDVHQENLPATLRRWKSACKRKSWPP